MTDHIERLRELLARATPGPWYLQSYGTEHAADIITRGRMVSGDPDSDCAGLNTADAAFIVAMRNALPALLALWEAAREATRGVEHWERHDAIGYDRLEKLEKLAELVANLEKLQ